jgi:hypothetical protein
MYGYSTAEKGALLADEGTSVMMTSRLAHPT